MRFYPVKSTVSDSSALEADHKNAYTVGIVRAGRENLFFRVRLKTYYIPYSDVRRMYRRVTEVPAKMCCGKGNFAMEQLVVCDEEKELAVIGLPGTKAARLLMEDLKAKVPGALFTAPVKPDAAENASEPEGSR